MLPAEVEVKVDEAIGAVVEAVAAAVAEATGAPNQQVEMAAAEATEVEVGAAVGATDAAVEAT